MGGGGGVIFFLHVGEDEAEDDGPFTLAAKIPFSAWLVIPEFYQFFFYQNTDRNVVVVDSLRRWPERRP